MSAKSPCQIPVHIKYVHLLCLLTYVHVGDLAHVSHPRLASYTLSVFYAKQGNVHVNPGLLPTSSRKQIWD